MAASVYLDFIAPNEIPDLVALHIFEAANSAGPFNEIEVVTAIGTQGSYITSYTTDKALATTDWFTIQWRNSKGALTDMSMPVQGGSQSLVAEIVSRALLRDPSLNEAIVAQEAEIAVSEYYGTQDPLSIPVQGVPLKTLSGLTYFTMARSYVAKASSTTTTAGGKWVAGLVSLDTSSSSKTTNAWDNIEALLRIANRELGRSYSVILLLEEIEVAGRYKQLVAADLSRNIIEVQ
jgi:hypothetical protein